MEAFHVEKNVRKKSTREARSARLLLPHMPIQFDQTTSPSKRIVEAFVADRFQHHYQAKVTHFLPYLISTKTDGMFTAAMGFQPAGSVKPLFLEQYLDTSIEAEISRVTGNAVGRQQIAEVGNLTSVHRGTSQLLFVLTIAILHEAGFEWTVFTATKQVQHLLARLNLVIINLCEANPDKLVGDKQLWGSYYNDKPNVMIGNLTDAIALLRQHEVIGFMLKNYQQTITDIAQKITQ